MGEIIFLLLLAAIGGYYYYESLGYTVGRFDTTGGGGLFPGDLTHGPYRDQKVDIVQFLLAVDKHLKRVEYLNGEILRAQQRRKAF